MKPMTIPAAFACAVLMAAPVAFAAPMGTEGPPTAAQVQAFTAAKISIDDAMSAAEKQSGGKALDAAFAMDNGTPVYHVKTVNGETVSECTINANNGQMVGATKKMNVSQLDQEDKAEVNGLKQATISLDQAIDKAEQKVGGKAMDAGMEQASNQSVYQVQVVKNGSAQKVTVHPGTGEVG